MILNRLKHGRWCSFEQTRARTTKSWPQKHSAHTFSASSGTRGIALAALAVALAEAGSRGALP
jgi:hypothetical protein